MHYDIDTPLSFYPTTTSQQAVLAQLCEAEAVHLACHVSWQLSAGDLSSSISAVELFKTLLYLQLLWHQAS